MREMRRKDRALTEEESLEILTKGEYCVIAVNDPDGQPYALPLSYVWQDGRVLFHCAQQGRKIDAFKADDRAALTVVRGVEAVYDQGFSTYYQSVMAFGRIVEITDDAAKRAALKALAEKYLPDDLPKADDEINRMLGRTAVYEMQIDHFSGKSKKKKA